MTGWLDRWANRAREVPINLTGQQVVPGWQIVMCFIGFCHDLDVEMVCSEDMEKVEELRIYIFIFVS